MLSVSPNMPLPISKTVRESYYAGYYAGKGMEKNFLLSSFFDVIFRLEFNLDVISNKLEWSPVPHLRILL